MAKKIFYRGSVSLIKNAKGEGLSFETIIRNSGPFAGVPGVFIPIGEMNPAVYCKKKDDGTKIINLDIEVVPTPGNQYGNSHFIRLDVGKENRQKYNIQNDQLKNHKPIVGNLKQYEYDDQGGGRHDTQEDMPANIAGSNAPQEFDGSW